MNRGAHVSEPQPSALSSSEHQATLSRNDKRETSWINVFSVVSRPAMSFLQKYFPGLLQSRSLTDRIPEWVSEDLKPTLSGKEVAYLRKLADVMPCGNAGRLMEPRSESNQKWMTEESFSELGIKDGGDIEKEIITGDFSIARNRGHVLLNAGLSTEATTSLLQNDWGSHTWWGGFWGSDDRAQSWLSKLSLGKGEGVRAAHCSPPPSGTKATVAKTTALCAFVQFSSWESMASENAGGHSSNTQQPVDNGILESPQPESLKCSDALVLQQEPSINETNISAGAATVFSEVAVLTPDQDNGYSSLEEGHALCQHHMVMVVSKEELQVAGDIAIVETETFEPTEGPSQAAEGMEEEGAKEETCDVGGNDGGGAGGEVTPQEGSSTAADTITSPYCQNRTIAFIMGRPCSDDDDDDDADSLSDSEFSDCDDGFDSEGSSEISDSDSDDSDNAVDPEADRLWNSLCQTQDPYNPRNFTAPIITGPRPIPSTSAAAACSSSDSSPDSSPDQGAASATPLALSVSPPGQQQPDSWDDSTSASEAEDADGLWNSFSSSSDPYSLRNFQAPLRTEPSRPKVKAAAVKEGGQEEEKKKPTKVAPRLVRQVAAASLPPQYRREEAEDRLDSGFSELPAPTAAASVASPGCGVVKKVRFCEEVEEFATSSREEEDRRGQWEELARDRCRFSRRCRDVEDSIAYCLEPRHRALVYQRLTEPTRTT